MNYNNGFPSPSARQAPTKKNKPKVGFVTEQFKTVKNNYDNFHLQLHNSGRNSPAVQEVVNRKYNEKLQTDLEDCKQEKDKLIAELQQVKESKNELITECTNLKKTNEELNQTLQDIRFNQTGMTAYSEFAGDMAFVPGSPSINMAFEREELSTIKKRMTKLQTNVEFLEKSAKREKAQYAQDLEKSEAQINNLRFQLNEAAAELQECDEKIKENMDLNKTINAEKTRFQMLSENYEEKLRTYETRTAQIEAENALKSADFLIKKESMDHDIRKAYEKLNHWREKADKKTNELAVMNRRLNRERGARKNAETVANQRLKLYRKGSIRNKTLERKNQKIKEEKMELERELASSRLLIRQYEEESKKSFFHKIVKNLACMKK